MFLKGVNTSSERFFDTFSALNKPNVFRQFFKGKSICSGAILVLLVLVVPFPLILYVDGSQAWPIILGTCHLVVLLLFYFLYSNGLVISQIILMQQ